MDPKMDTGMVMDDIASRPVFDINKRVTPTEFIWIFDNILIGQVIARLPFSLVVFLPRVADCY